MYVLDSADRSTPPPQDFHSFSFDTPATHTSFDVCDPLFSNPQETDYGVFCPQATNIPCSPYTDPYASSTLTVDTSFLHTCASSSPLSSMPGTPQTYPNMQNPSVPPMDAEVMSLAMGYDDSFEYVPEFSTYTTDVAPNMSTSPSTYASPEYTLDSKSDFAPFYKTDFFPQPFTTYFNPSFRM